MTLSWPLLIAAAVVAFEGNAAPSAASLRQDPERLLWSEILLLRDRATSVNLSAPDAPPAATRPAGADFAAARDRRAALLHRVQRYGALFPGGAHREEALRIELLALFELGSLAGGDFTALRERIAEYMRHPPCPGAPHEAAYWSTVTLEPAERPVSEPLSQRQTSAHAPDAIVSPKDASPAPLLPASQPATGPLEPTPLDDRLAAAWADYVQRHPDSRYTPRLTRALFEDAEKAGDLATMERLAAAMETHFPERAGTRLLAARLRRFRAVGHPFWLTFRAGDETIDTRRHAGAPVLIVVWSSDDGGRSETLCREVAAFKTRHPETAVAGVCLDYRSDTMETFAEELALNWPQSFDGRGPANEFALAWGVTRTPTVFVLDRSGRLLGVTGASAPSKPAEAWKALAEKALEN